MEIKQAFRYASMVPDSFVVLSGEAWAVIHPRLFLVCGKLNMDDILVFREDGFTERFSGSKNVFMNKTESGKWAFYNTTKDLILEEASASVSRSVIDFAASMSPNEDWVIDVLREDFLLRTTHIKAGNGRFCRGKVDENGAWRPVGLDDFAGCVYDARIINECWRERVDLASIRLSNLVDDEDTPLYFHLGDLHGCVVRTIV